MAQKSMGYNRITARARLERLPKLEIASKTTQNLSKPLKNGAFWWHLISLIGFPYSTDKTRQGQPAREQHRRPLYHQPEIGLESIGLWQAGVRQSLYGQTIPRP